LHFALDRRDVAMTQLLLEHGCPVNEPFPHNEEGGPKKGEPPLTTLIRMNGVDLVGGTLGFEPTEARRWELTRMLLAAGADPNLPGARGWTPLQLALPAVVGHPDLRIAELLVAAGADPDDMPSNARSETPRAVATKRGLSDFLELFKSANG